jgi:hypothetical protein
LDWSHRYRRTIESLGSLKVKSAYLDGELCALNSEGVSVFSRCPDLVCYINCSTFSVMDTAKLGRTRHAPGPKTPRASFPDASRCEGQIVRCAVFDEQDCNPPSRS